MDIDEETLASGSMKLPAISVAEASPSKRPAPLNLEGKRQTLPSFDDLFVSVNIDTPVTPFTRLSRAYKGDLSAMSPLRSPLRSPFALSVPSLSLQPATPVVSQSSAGAAANATYLSAEQLVNNDFEIDPALTDASTPINTPPENPLFSLPIPNAKDMLRHETISYERNVVAGSSPGRSYSSHSPNVSPYRHMNNGWDSNSIAPAQISRSPSPILIPMLGSPNYSDDEPAGHMEMDMSPGSHVSGWGPQAGQASASTSTATATGYFAYNPIPSANPAPSSAMATPNDGLYPSQGSTPGLTQSSGMTPSGMHLSSSASPVHAPVTPPRQIRAASTYPHSAPPASCAYGYANASVYSSPAAQITATLEHTVPPGAAFDQWSGLSPAAAYNRPAHGEWSDPHGRHRHRSPARSVGLSPSPARAPLPSMYSEHPNRGDYRNSYAPSPSPSPGPSTIPLAAVAGPSTGPGTASGTGPMRPGTIHGGRVRHNPVNQVRRRRSGTGVALNQFARLTSDLVYPAYEGAIRQWTPIIIDPDHPVPAEYRDKRGFWDANCFWTWDSTVKMHAHCIRICAQCHTALTGANTWRRSHIQQDTGLCNKCGIYEHTHQHPRPPRPTDAGNGYDPSKRVEIFNKMLASRSRPKKGAKGTPSPPLKFQPNPVFGVVDPRSRRGTTTDNNAPGPSQAAGPSRRRGRDDDDYRPTR